MHHNLFTILFGTKQNRDLKILLPLVRKINTLETSVMKMKDNDFKEKTEEFKKRYTGGESLDSILPEAFAMVREAARRILGERIFDVQLMGGIVLHSGSIMEMKTGEGKTLSSVTAAYLNALTSKGVHIVTVNDYLAERDKDWMGPVFEYMGLSVGAILSQMDDFTRKEAYRKDITYGTNNEFGFDYLRDNMKWDNNRKAQRGHHYCIVDEIDSILIDEARTPLIISGAAEDDTAAYYEVNKLIYTLEECKKDPETEEYPEEPEGDFKLDEKRKHVTFTVQGMNKIEQILLKRSLINDSLFSSDNFEYIHYFTQALKAHKLFHRDVDYVVKDGKVQIVDEFTGRILYGRRYSGGLHQAIEAKEKIRIAQRNRTLATITFQNYFRMYEKLSGMTGTADTEAKEFANIYDLEVVVIPTNRPVVRADNDDVIFLSERDKFNAICDEIESLNKKGQPILVGTVSIEKSEKLSKLLVERGIRHEILNAKNHHREALIIAQAGAKGSVTIATNMAGRGTDIKLGGNPEFLAKKKAGTNALKEEFEKIYHQERERWLTDYNEIKNLGGLHIVGTERHEARRIDNQLRGRSGRQGDPGSSRFFISLDDVLMRLFGGDKRKGIMSAAGMRDGEPIFHPWLNKLIENAQKRVEERNFEIRKHLLEYDDVLNKQRTFIYSRRDEILKDNDLKARILRTLEDIIQDIFERFQVEKKGDFSYIPTILKEELYYKPDFNNGELTSLEKWKERILEEIRSNLDQKEETLGKNLFNTLIRAEYLRNIDIRWQDHLEQLESLREAVYLRTFAQRNPLLEYKLEGFQIFDEMLLDIRKSIARKILNVKIQGNENIIKERRVSGSANHKALGQFALSQENREARPSGLKNVQVKRTVPKVGRNDPCPCGSGKKYKHCHGR
jgi:preprotein translocase subunit SecA